MREAVRAIVVAWQGSEAFDRVHLRQVDVVSEAAIDQERFLAEYRAGLGRSDVILDSGRASVGLVDLAAYRIEEAARC